MSASADEVPDDFSDLDPEAVGAGPPPVTGSRGTGDGGGKPRAATTRTRQTRIQKKLTDLQVRLSKEMFMGGTIIGLALPVTGYYTCQESDAFTSAIVELASGRPEWIEALEKLADIGPGLTIGRTVVGLGAALAVDRGRADPEKQFMRFLGVYSAWKSIEDKKAPGEGDYASQYRPPPAHPFQPVS